MKYGLTSKWPIAFLAIATAMLIPTTSHAQEGGACYMRSEGGNVIDLSRLCRAPQPLQARIKRREGGIPVIDVTFNGRQSFEMLVDTGASGTAITPQMAQALGVISEGTASFSTAGGVVESPIGRVSSIAAGGVVVENVPVSINGFLEIGLLGQDFFGSYDVIIKQNTIEFRPR